MTTKIINFFDGYTTGSTPTQIGISNLVSYTDDASFEADNAGSPVLGNLYYNTTDNSVRYYQSAWKSLSDEDDIASVISQIMANSSNIATNTANITSNATNLNDFIVTKGQASGLAPLDSTSKVPALYLPSYVDDVEEYADLASFPATGETGKIYVDLATNKTYRWGGTTYVEISPSDVNSVNGQTGAVVIDSSNFGLENVTNDAQLKREAGDFDTFTLKESSVADDIVLIEDSEDSFNKKKVKLQDLIGGGGGGLDVLFTEDFENDDFIDLFVTGNNATPDSVGTGTPEGSGSEITINQLNGTKSLIYTQGFGINNINDYITWNQDIPVFEEQIRNFLSFSFIYKYNGNEGDVRFFVLDQNDNELTENNELLAKTTKVENYNARVYIPQGVTAVRFGFQVLGNSAGSVLVFDNVVISSKPFTYTDIYNLTNRVNFTPVITNGPTVSSNTASWSREGEYLNIQGSLIASGSGPAAEISIDLPVSGITSDVENVVGTFRNLDAGTAHYAGTVNILANKLVFYRETAASTLRGNAFANGDLLSYTCRIPISEWTSTSSSVVTPAKSGIETFRATFNGGRGSTNTAIPYWNNEHSNTLSRLGTLVNDSISGLEFTAKKKVLVVATMGMSYSTNNYFGFSLNSTQLTTGFGSITEFDRLSNGFTSSSNSELGSSWSGFMEPGDVLRPHVDPSSATINVGSRSSISLTVVDFEQQVLSAIPRTRTALVYRFSSTNVASVANGTLDHPFNNIDGDSELAFFSGSGFEVRESGYYDVELECSAFGVNHSKAYLYNSTDTTIMNPRAPMTYAASPSNTVTTQVVASLRVFLEVGKEYRLRQYTETARANGIGGSLGAKTGDPGTVGAIIAQVKLTKL